MSTEFRPIPVIERGQAVNVDNTSSPQALPAVDPRGLGASSTPPEPDMHVQPITPQFGGQTSAEPLKSESSNNPPPPTEPPTTFAEASEPEDNRKLVQAMYFRQRRNTIRNLQAHANETGQTLPAPQEENPLLEAMFEVVVRERVTDPKEVAKRASTAWREEDIVEITLHGVADDNKEHVRPNVSPDVVQATRRSMGVSMEILGETQVIDFSGVLKVAEGVKAMAKERGVRPEAVYYSDDLYAAAIKQVYKTPETYVTEVLDNFAALTPERIERLAARMEVADKEIFSDITANESDLAARIERATDARVQELRGHRNYPRVQARFEQQAAFAQHLARVSVRTTVQSIWGDEALGQLSGPSRRRLGIR